MEILQEHREAAQLEAAVIAEGNKMSERAVAKLRAVNQANHSDKVATEKFLADFKRLPKDTWTLTQLLKRILSADQNAMTLDKEAVAISKTPIYAAPILERMANKLIWSLQHGWFPASVGNVMFLAELTPDESKMPEDKFYRTLEGTAADKPVVINQRVAVTSTETKKEWWTPERCREQGLCKAGKLCVKATKGKPALRAEGKQFCGDVCREAYPIRIRNQRVREMAN